MPPELADDAPPPRGWPAGFGEGPAEREALLRLAHAVFVPPRRIHELAWRSGSARAVVDRALAGELGRAARARVGAVDVGSARRALRRAQASLVTPADPAYPPSLLDLADPPAALFVRGARFEVPWPAVAVAVVGSRSASGYGEEVAQAIGRGLAAAGVPVISGAAYGIDQASHVGALAIGGPTVAVLGSGIDVAYPAVHSALIDDIASHGCVVSEYPPGEPARPKQFPARNRIVVGLANAVVVVEGAAGSGSLISAEFAQQLGREILAVPGSVTSTLSEVPHALIRDGAVLVRGPADVLEAVTGFRGYAGAVSLERVDDEHRRVLDALVGAPVTAEAVAASTGIPLGRVLAALSALELGGLVRDRGGRYERTIVGLAR